VLPLEQAFSIPRGTQVAANRCAATLSAGRRAPRARANGGRFVLLRAGTRRKALTLGLAGASFSACRGAPTSRQVRALTVRARGRVSVAARYATSVGRDARWTVEDLCDSTVTRVRRGKVRVTDRGHRRTVTVRAGNVHVSATPRGGAR
jgi:hypothetical protein